MSGDPSYDLLRAVRDGNVQTAKTLIDTFGLSYSEEWSSGYILLRKALENEHEELSKLLLKSGSKVNSKSKRPAKTPLHIAVKNGYTEIVSMLLARGARVNAKNHADETPLHIAADQGSPEIVKLLIKQGAYIDTKSKTGTSVLHRAVEMNHVAIADELLNHGADVNTICIGSWKNGYTPLHFAAEKGNEPMVKLLLSKGAEINATTSSKVTPLYVATERNHEKIVKFLLEKGANVDACDEDGKTILQVAVQTTHLTMIEEILHFRPDVKSNANRGIFYAAMNGPNSNNWQKIVDALLRYGFTVRAEDAKDAEFLHMAVMQGHLKLVDALLKIGADVNTLHNIRRGVTLLHTAAFYRQIEITELLLSRGASASVQDDMRKLAVCYAIHINETSITKLLSSSSASVELAMELLHIVAKQGNRKIVETLLQLAPNVDVNACDKFGRTALHHTALNEYQGTLSQKDVDARAEMAKMFLSRGARVNAETKKGKTALHLAAEEGLAKVVEVLLENKADVNSQTQQRTTPLHLAAERNNVAVVKMLLDCGAYVNVRQLDGTTALHTASNKGHEEVVKLLVEQGADLDAKDKEKSSPLHLATVSGHPIAVHTLLELGANIEATDKLGRTALHVASKHGWPIIAQALFLYGADINVTCNNSMTPLDYATLGIIESNNRRDERNFGRRVEHDFRDGDYFDRYSPDGKAFSIPDHDHFYDDFADNYDKVSDCSCKHVAAILVEHIIRMKALNLYVSDKNLRAIILEYNYDNALKFFRTEIASMRIKKISDSNVTFYDVLTKNINQLAVYARNESIVQALESKDFDQKFPGYHEMMFVRFKQGQKRERLLNSSLKSLNVLSGYVLPDLSAMELFNYLSNKDLENLIKADPSAGD